MRAAVFAAPGELRLCDMDPRPAGDDDEVELLVEACGICGSDLHVLDVPPGHPALPGVVLGHEFVGRVVSGSRSAQGPQPGDRVVVESVVPCTLCSACRSGRRSHCENLASFGISRDGGLAERVFVPARACHAVSSTLEAPIAALAEPLACVLSAYLTAPVAPGASVAVVGGGPAGQMFVELYRRSGADVLLVETNPSRRDMARRLGRVTALDPGELREGDWECFDVVVDAVGSQLDLALRLARAQGTVLLYGMDGTATNRFAQFDVTRRELTIKGTYAGVQAMPEAVRLLESGGNFGPMVTAVALEELPAAIQRLRAGLEMKVTVCMTS